MKQIETEEGKRPPLTQSEMDSRIKELPYYMSWENSAGFNDSIRETGEIDYSGLTDPQKLFLYVYAWNCRGICPRKKGISKLFGWTNYKIQKTYRQTDFLSITGTFSEDTGLITGSGYIVDHSSIIIRY